MAWLINERIKRLRTKGELELNISQTKNFAEIKRLPSAVKA
jgi:hypothetical protein